VLVFKSILAIGFLAIYSYLVKHPEHINQGIWQLRNIFHRLPRAIYEDGTWKWRPGDRSGLAIFDVDDTSESSLGFVLVSLQINRYCDLLYIQ